MNDAVNIRKSWTVDLPPGKPESYVVIQVGWVVMALDCVPVLHCEHRSRF